MRRYRESYREVREEPEERDHLSGAGKIAWAVFLLILAGLTVLSWYGSIYVFGHPERPYSYAMLQRLNKIDSPTRFELKDAPKGQFVGAGRFLETHKDLNQAELDALNLELVRGYIKNYSQTKAKIPYLTGNFRVIHATELTENDLMSPGVVALAESVEAPGLLVEYLYPSEPDNIPRILRSLKPGMEIQLHRTEELSAVTHLKPLPNGQLLASVVNLNYGSYVPSEGSGGFELAPPKSLNLYGGWPVIKPAIVAEAGRRFVAGAPVGSDQQARRPGDVGGIESSAASLSASRNSAPAGNEPARPPAKPPETAAAPRPQATPRVEVYEPSGADEGPPEMAALFTEPTRPAAPLPGPSTGEEPRIMRAQPLNPTNTTSTAPAPTAFPTPPSVARAIPVQPVPAIPAAPLNTIPPSAPTPAPTPQPFVAAAVPVTPNTAQSANRNWQTYPPGQMPRGRLVQSGEISRVADTANPSDRLYLSGEFVVTASDRERNRAVLRARGGIGSQIMGLAPGSGNQTRIIVDYPAGYTPPDAGTSIDRDASRAFQIISTQRSGGVLNVYVREVIAR